MRLKKWGGFYNGKYYGIPHEMSNYVAWINTAYMKEAGLDPEKDIPKTWEEFVEVGKKMTKRDGEVITRNGFAINVKAAVFPFLILHSLMEQKGLDWSSEAGFLASLDTPEAVDALTTFTNWATTDGIFDPGLFENEREGFGNGLCATFLTGGTWYWGVLDQYSVPREDVAPMRYPRFKDGQDIGGVVYGYSVFVAKQAKNTEWAWKWLDFLESRPEAYIAHGYFQPRKSLDPALADKYIPNNDVFGVERSTGAAIIASAKLNELQDAVGAAASRVIFEGMAPEESLQVLKDDVEMILE
ncbi:MAG: extracellular solute-binding protein [bacterium]|nr:extracellular solute-binding protein [bacterium]